MKIIIKTILVMGSVFHLLSLEAQVIRKNYREMSASEKTIFVNALYALKQNGVINAYANHHNAYFNAGIHHSADFLPWHRWFILHFEKALQNSGVTGAASISLPYWDWTSVYYTTPPTDAQTTSPLWNYGFLGQFNSTWNLNRTLAAIGFLPNQSAVQQVMVIPDYFTFVNQVENITHSVPHNWVGGVMSSNASPADPIFYLHHSMVDKLWQDWTNLGHFNALPDNNMPAFPSGVPYVNPYSIVDSRSVKVWFAENNRVYLYWYTVNGTEKYNYTGTILCSDFQIPSGGNCSIASVQNVVLQRGFKASAGSKLLVKTGTTSPSPSFIALDSEDGNKTSLTDRNDVKIFPNPSADKFNVLLFDEEIWDKATPDSYYEVCDVIGRVVTSSKITEHTGMFQVDLSDHPKGIYMLKISFGNGKSAIHQLSLN